MYRERKTKRWISIIICIALILTMLPGGMTGLPEKTVLAEETPLPATKTVTFKFDDFSGSNADLLILNNSAAIAAPAVEAENEVTKVLRVCPATGGCTGSVFNKNRVSLSDDPSFSTYFEYNMNTPNGGADGFVFVIQTEANNVGSQGGGIGYGGIQNSLGIEFDTYKNPEFKDPDDNHIAINIKGDVTNYLKCYSPVFDINNGGNYHVWIDYNNENHILEVRINTSNIRPADPSLSVIIPDLGAVLGTNNVYAGFTSATGGSWQNHDILKWYFNNAYDPINIADTSIIYKEAPANVNLSVSDLSASPCAITAKVTNLDGTNASGITVNFSSTQPAVAVLSSDSAVTDDNGTASVNFIRKAPGTVYIKAVAQGGAYGMLPFIAPSITTVPVVPSAESPGSGNYIQLDYNANDTDNSHSYHYMVTKKDLNVAGSQSQTIPLKSTAKVLNIYPRLGDDITFTDAKGVAYTVPKSASVKMWMEKPVAGAPLGYGKGLITVDTVYIGDFNNNPDGYLKDENGKYKYDVVFVGAWDSNNSADINETAKTCLQSFINYGGGYLAGHDTVNAGTSVCNLTQLGIANLNMQCQTSLKLYGDSNTNSILKCIKNGLLTNYPWTLSANTLTVPASHTTNQFAMGDVWINYQTNAQNQTSEITSLNGKAGTNNFYLTTWNNTAMIQTGHSNGSATEDEQKILANTLLYLSQVSYDTKSDDHSAQDLTAPNKVPEASLSFTINNPAKSATIRFGAVGDNGNTYQYQLHAISNQDTDGDNAVDTYLSDTKEATIISGLKGYSIVVDKNANTDPGNTVNLYTNEFTTPGDLANGNYYVHIKAIDYAGNISETTHVPFIVSGNTAPVLNNSTASVLPAINEDDSNSEGVQVSDLISGKVTDADIINASDITTSIGIAVTGLDNSHGCWDYKNADGLWWQIPRYGATISENNALLLSPSTRVRFRPAANYNGTASLNFRACDQTGGTVFTSGDERFGDTTVNGGSAPFSKNIQTANITVNPVDDTPIILKRIGSKILQFDGSAQYVSVPDMQLNESFSIGAWINAQAANNWSRVFDFGSGEQNNNQWLGFCGTEGTMQFETFNGTVRSKNNIITTEKLPLNTWVYVTAVYDQDKKMGYIYWNGELKASGPMDTTNNGKPIRSLNYLGRSNWAQDYYFQGSMYAISVWNTARSQNQIKSDMGSTLTGNEAGLVAYYPIIKEDTAVVTDVTGKGHTGILNGATLATHPDFVYNASGSLNQAIDINNIRLMDVDAGNADMLLTLSASNGIITFDNTTGLTFKSDGPNKSKSVAVTGSLEMLNQALTTLKYTPDTDYLGSDTVTLILSDQGNTINLSTTKTISIHILPLTNSSLSGFTLKSGSVDVTYSPVFAPDIYSYQAANQPFKATNINIKPVIDSEKHQTVTVNGVTISGSITSQDVALNVGENVIKVEVTAQDGITKSVYQIKVTRLANQKPVSVSEAVITDENTPVTGTLKATDADGDALTYAVVTNPAKGSVVLGENGSYIYTPNASFAGTDSFTFKASDGTDESAPATITITVKDKTGPVITLNGSPEITIQLGSTYEDAGATAKDTYDNAATEVTVSSNVDTMKSGTYYVQYSSKDSAGNEAVKVTRKVIVAPAFNAIAINMKTPDNNTYNETWTDKDVTFTLTGGISTIAFKKFQYSIDKAVWKDMEGAGFNTLTVSASQNAVYYFRAYSIDDSTGPATDGTAVKIDKSMPTIDVTNNATAWTKNNVILNVAATSGISGIASVTVSRNGGAAADITGNTAFYATSNGTYLFTVKSNSGLTAEKTVVVDKIDKVNPIFNVESIKSGSGNYDYSPDIPSENDVVITLTNLSGNISGVTYYYSTNGLDWTPITGNAITVSDTNNSTFNYSFKAISGSGLESITKVFSSVYIVKPVFNNLITVSAKTSDGNTYSGTWTNKDITFTLSGGINKEAFLKYQYSTDSSNWSDMGGLNHNTLTISDGQDATYYFRVMAKSLSTGSVTGGNLVKLDKTLPQNMKIYTKSAEESCIEREVNNPIIKVFYKNQIEVKLAASDNGSGVKQIWYQTDGTQPYAVNEASWIKNDTAGETTFNLDKDFKGVIYAAVIDNAGNISDTVSLPIVIEGNQPVLSVVPDSSNDWSSTGITFTVNANDEGTSSGINKVSYVTQKGESGVIPADADADLDKTNDKIEGKTFTVNENGNYDVTITAQDNAGNTTAITRTVKIDKLPPDIIVTPAAGFVSGTWYNHDIVFNFTKTTANQSGVKYQYSTDGNSWADTNGAASQTFSGDTNASYKFRSINSSGIAGTPSDAYIVKIKVTAPALPVVNTPADTWYAKDQYLSVTSPVDTEHVGIKAQYHIKTDSGSFSQWTDVADGRIPVTQNGINVIETRTVNMFDNTQGIILRTIKLDKTLPADLKIYTRKTGGSFTEEIPGNQDFKVFYKEKAEVKLTAADNVSGIKELWYQLDGTYPYEVNNTGWIKKSTTGEITLNIEPDFKGMIYVTAVDNAGNAAENIYLPVVVEDNQPVLTVTPGDAAEWSSKDVVFAVNAGEKDTASGIREVSYVTDKGENGILAADADADSDKTNDKITDKNFTVSENGDYNVTVTAKDYSGNVTTTQRNVKIDKVKPNINVTQPEGFISGTWYNHDIVFNFTKTTDNKSGVRYQYSTDGISWTYTNGAASQTFTGNTNAVYMFRSINASGITSNPTTGYSVKIKVTAPALPAVDTPADTWYAKDQYLSVTSPVDTEHVGIKAQYRIKTDSGSFSQWTDVADGRILVTQNGINVIETRTVNMFDNTQGIILRTIKLDKTLPADLKIYTRKTGGSFTEEIPGNPDFKVFYKEKAEVKLTAADNVSGIKEIWYQLDGTYPYEVNNTGWIKKSTAGEITVNLDPDFKGMIYVTAIDNAGNIADSVYLPVVVEDNQPVLTVTPGDAADWGSTDVIFTVNAGEKDTASGISEVSYVTDKGESGILAADADADSDKTNDKITDKTFTVSKNGDYTVTVTAKDNSGNVITTQRNVKIDKVKPDINVTQPEGFISGSWYNHDIVFNFGKTTDNKSGVRYQYTTDGISWTNTNGAASQTFAGNTNAVYMFRSINASGVAGNPTKGYSVKIKVTSPTLPTVETPEDIWYAKDQYLTVVPPDNSENVGIKAQYRIKTDNGAYSLWTDVENDKVPVTKNGINTIELRTVNVFVNTQGTVLRTIKLDKTIPQVIIKDIPHKHTNGIITVDFNTTTGPSGVKNVTVNGESITGNKYNIDNNGSYEFIITSIAGLSSAHKVVIDQIDRSIPLITGAMDGGSYYFGRQLNFEDDNGPIAEITDNGVSISNNAWICTPGEHTIIAYDDVGNRTIITFTVKAIPFTVQDIRIVDKAALDEIRKDLTYNKGGMPVAAAEGFDDQISRLEKRIAALENQISELKNTVDKLPAVDSITLRDENRIKSAVSLYNSLTDEQKEALGAQKEILNSLETKINELKEDAIKKTKEEAVKKAKEEAAKKAKEEAAKKAKEEAAKKAKEEAAKKAKEEAAKKAKEEAAKKAKEEAAKKVKEEAAKKAEEEAGKKDKKEEKDKDKSGLEIKAGESNKKHDVTGNDTNSQSQSEAGNTSAKENGSGTQNPTGAENTSENGKESNTQNVSKAENASETGNGSGTQNPSEGENASETRNGSGTQNASGEENASGTGNGSGSQNPSGVQNSSDTQNNSEEDNKSQAPSSEQKDASGAQDKDTSKTDASGDSSDTGENTKAGDNKNQILVNEETQTTVESIDNSFDPDVFLVVEEVSESSDKAEGSKEEAKQIDETIQKASSAVKNNMNHKELAGIYDISLMKGNTAIQPDGDIKVRIKIPDRLKGRTGMDIVHITDDGKVTSMHATVSEDGNYLEFITNHFSYYGIVVNQVYQWWWLLILLIIILVWFIKKRLDDRRNNYNIGKYIK